MHDNVFRDNRITRNAGDGITLDVTFASNVVERNYVSHNGDDGIDLTEGGTVTRNRANHNADLGIEATPASVDGGGNKASGNGNPLQCLNVFCK
jgi:parallel beta-helix repeat protein